VYNKEISEFNRFFKKQSLANTYKPTFVKCLLDIRDCQKLEGKDRQMALVSVHGTAVKVS